MDLGDWLQGLGLYFGYPQAHEDDAERAVRAGLELVAAVGGLKTDAPLKARVGIATGLVVVGDLIGSGASQEQAIVGETPNLAAAGCGRANVVIAESTRKLVGSLFELEDLGAQELKGISGPMRFWTAVRPVSNRTPPPAIIERLRASAAHDAGDLGSDLSRRAEARRAEVARELVTVGEQESEALRKLLADQRERIAKREAAFDDRQLSLEFDQAAPQQGRGLRGYLLNKPMICALAKVLKCRLKPTTAAEVSGFTSSLSVFTANTVNR